MEHIVRISPRQSSTGTMYHQYELDIYKRKKDNQIAEIDGRKDGFYYFWNKNLRDVYCTIDEAHQAAIRDIVGHLAECDHSLSVSIDWQCISSLQKPGIVNYFAFTL